MRACICGLMAVAMVVSLAGCRRSRAEREKDEMAKLVREADEDFERLVAGKEEDGDRVMEARQYLAPNQDRNRLWKTSRDQTLFWVDQFYQAGAARVYAVYAPADRHIQFNMCAMLLIELPSAPQARAKVLVAFNRTHKHLWGPGEDKATDVGQKFLLLNMDP